MAFNRDERVAVTEVLIVLRPNALFFFADAWAYRLKDPNSSVPTIPSLLEVAEAFDIGLDVRFRRFSELLDDATTLTPESFVVPSFNSELHAGTFIKKSRQRKAPKGLKLIKPQRRTRGSRRIGTQQVGKGDYGVRKTG